MGFVDFLESAARGIKRDMEKKTDEISKKYTKQLRGLSDTQLMSLLIKKENEGHDLAVSLIHDEMDRRGIRY